jgi:LacI family transcriptional regulator
MKNTATLADIAKVVGVTPMVVSEVLKGRNNRIRASAATREKILQVAKELNYRPNGSARAMRQSRFHNIGYLSIQDDRDYTVEAIESGICGIANQRHYRVTLIKHRFNWNPTEEEIPAYYREAHLDALIVNIWRHSLPKIAEDLLMSAGFPIVFFNDKRRHNSVYCDDVTGTRLLLDHLIAQGYRRISYLCFNMARIGINYSSIERRRSYTKFMTAAGLEPSLLLMKNAPFHEEVIQWLRTDPPEAIICENDNQTYVVQRALYELGWRAPDDLALAGFNGELLARLSPVPLTTIRLPFLKMAETIAEMAIQLAEDPAAGPLKSLKFQPELVTATSTQRPAGRKEK